MHVRVHLVDELFPHLEQLGPGHFVLAISDLRRLVRKTGCLEEAEHHLSVPPILHRHQTLVINGDGKLSSRFQSLFRIPILAGNRDAFLSNGDWLILRLLHWCLYIESDCHTLALRVFACFLENLGRG